MHPVVSLGGRAVEVRAYSLMLGVAAIVALGVATLVAGRMGLSRRRALGVFAAAVVGAIAGARLLHAATHVGLYSADPSRLWALDPTGFSLYGGLALGAVAGLAVARATGLRPWLLADAGALAAGAGIALARVGCFLEGCCYGLPTHLPWGVRFPIGSPAWTRQMVVGAPGGGGSPLASAFLTGQVTTQVEAVHPTQLYEAAAAIAGVVIVAIALRRRVRAGTASLMFGLWFSAFRLVNARLRWPPTTVTAPAWFEPVLYGGICVALAGVLLLRAAQRRAVVDVAMTPNS